MSSFPAHRDNVIAAKSIGIEVGDPYESWNVDDLVDLCGELIVEIHKLKQQIKANETK